MRTGVPAGTGAVAETTHLHGTWEEALLAVEDRGVPLGHGRGADPAVTGSSPILYAADLGECEVLSGLETARTVALFIGALERAGATIVLESHHVFPGAGLTCALILSESHAVLHTWPETGSVHVDIFSCSARLKGLEAIEELSRVFKARRVSVREVPRADGHSLPPEPAR